MRRVEAVIVGLAGVGFMIEGAVSPVIAYAGVQVFVAGLALFLWGSRIFRRR